MKKTVMRSLLFAVVIFALFGGTIVLAAPKTEIIVLNTIAVPFATTIPDPIARISADATEVLLEPGQSEDVQLNMNYGVDGYENAELTISSDPAIATVQYHDSHKLTIAGVAPGKYVLNLHLYAEIDSGCVSSTKRAGATALIQVIVYAPGTAPAERNLTSFKISAPPAKTAYTEGDKLNLTGLVLTYTDKKGKATKITPADFAANGVTASPADGATLDAFTTEVRFAHAASGLAAEQRITVAEQAEAPTARASLSAISQTGVTVAATFSEHCTFNAVVAPGTVATPRGYAALAQMGQLQSRGNVLQAGIPFTGLSPGTAYTAFVYGVNAAGQCTPIVRLPFTTVAAPAPPPAPVPTPTPGTITIMPDLLPDAQVNVPYLQTITASGGTAPYTFTISSDISRDRFPPSLTLAPDGTLSFTVGPGYAGTSFTFGVIAIDQNGKRSEVYYTLRVTGPAVQIALAPDTLPPAQLNTAYSQDITVTGGIWPYTFAVTDGALPAGLSWTFHDDSTGPKVMITGTVTDAALAGQSFSFTVTATDKYGRTGERQYTIVVPDPAVPITLLPAALANPIYNQPYSQTVAASGGTAPYTYAVSSGALPAGLSLAANGAISGTVTDPAAGGQHTFSITATDANNATGVKSYTIAVVTVITLSPETLPDAQLNNSYGQMVTASGGTAPYSYAVTDGALPAGLQLDPMGDNGFISGMVAPDATVGPNVFTITATDTNGNTGTRQYTITVMDPSPAPFAPTGADALLSADAAGPPADAPAPEEAAPAGMAGGAPVAAPAARAPLLAPAPAPAPVEPPTPAELPALTDMGLAPAPSPTPAPAELLAPTGVDTSPEPVPAPAPADAPAPTEVDAAPAPEPEPTPAPTSPEAIAPPEDRLEPVDAPEDNNEPDAG